MHDTIRLHALYLLCNRSHVHSLHVYQHNTMSVKHILITM